MISITSLTADYFGDLILNESPKTITEIYQRRNTRTATLDGFATINDLGYTASDNTFSVKIDKITKSELDILIRFVKMYSLVRLSCKDGVFIGAINNLTSNSIPIEFIFQVKQKLTD